MSRDELKAMLVVLTPGGESVQDADTLNAVASKITRKYAGGCGSHCQGDWRLFGSRRAMEVVQ